MSNFDAGFRTAAGGMAGGAGHIVGYSPGKMLGRGQFVSGTPWTRFDSVISNGRRYWPMLDELKIAFHLRRKPSVNEAVREIERRVGPNGKAIWLATRTGVRRYGPFSAALQYPIPREAIMISDLGSEGQLFIMTEETWKRMGQP